MVTKRSKLCLIMMLTLYGCSTKNMHICEMENNRHLGPCAQIADEAYIYALLSVNSYEKEENTPFILPANIKEVRHADSQVSQPSPHYVDSNVYDNGSFQAKVYEIRSATPENGILTFTYQSAGTRLVSIPDQMEKAVAGFLAQAGAV